ncbi:MAG: hypothetical protein L6R36_004055 [Xanthoria steineri]|nr:MAG: hypothetical protein L6R36_004055 [Xanthoria steineri]
MSPFIRRKGLSFGDLNTPLLRTNRQICTEASSVLYSTICFHIRDPEQFVSWLDTIGIHNVKRLKNLALVVQSEYEAIPETAPSTGHISQAIALSRSACSQFRQSLTRWTDKATEHHLLRRLASQSRSAHSQPRLKITQRNEKVTWYHVLRFLACEATGLRLIFLSLIAEEDDEEIQGAYGAGKDMRFLRELGRIRNLQSMVLFGYYAPIWSSYLTEKMGIKVEEGKRNKEGWEALWRYQLGTEGLIP